jgi:hypothetical protein
MSNNNTDWKKHFQDNQHLDERMVQIPLQKDVYQKNSPMKWWLRRQRFEQYKMATGLGMSAILTKYGFAYLGGMYQARRQFINSPLYFRNHYYNWISGLKYIAMGYVVGVLISTFAFGHPYLLEDLIRAKFRGYTAAHFMDKGYKPLYYCY